MPGFKLIKGSFYLNFLILVLLAFFAGFLTKPPKLEAQAPANPDLPSDEEVKQCAEDLTEYMNAVLEDLDSVTLNHAKLVSPAFNMTSFLEDKLYQYMVEFGADFDKLDYFAGNAYTLRPGGSVLLAYDFYANMWKSRTFGKPFIFTEYGDFAKDASHTDPGHSAMLASMRSEFLRAAGDSTVEGIIYFNPGFPPLAANTGGNEGSSGGTSFEKHFLTEQEYRDITAPPGTQKAGINTASILDHSGINAQTVGALGRGWILEIITGPDESLPQYINNVPAGVKPFIRLCYGPSCPFKDPMLLSNYIKMLDSSVSKDFWIIVGPNEPLTDPWVSEACGIVEERDWEWSPVNCEGPFVDPEFHSLRPYPGNFCLPGEEPVKRVVQCGNKITASESFDLEWQEDKMSIWGVEGPPNGPCIEKRVPVVLTYDTVAEDDVKYTTFVRTWTCDGVPIQSKTGLTIDMTNSELPVLGNTEDVPNGRSGASNLTYANRVNNYVSWYLQGVAQTAEEEYASPTDPVGIRTMMDFAGPVQKLLPLGGFDRFDRPYGMVAQRMGERHESVDLGYNHDQIVVCKQGGGPVACYIDNNQSRVRQSEVRMNPLTIEFSYIPLSTTVDESGGIFTKRTGAQPGIEHGNEMGYLPPEADRINEADQGTTPWQLNENLDAGINWSDFIYFPHARESVQLADVLQRTYVPQDALREVDIVKTTTVLNPACIGVTELATCIALRRPLVITTSRIDTEEREDWMDTADGMPPVKAIDYEEDQFCVVRNAYEGPGDNLYGWLDKEDYEGDPNFAISAEENNNIYTEIIYEGEVSCTFSEEIAEGFDECMGPIREESCATSCVGGEVIDGGDECAFGEVLCRKYRDSDHVGDPESCVDRKDPRPCSTTTMASSYVELDIPWVEVIFNRLVNGSMSIYRHLFPRLAANNLNLPPEMQIITPGPEQFENIPGKTTADYNAKHITHLDTAEGGGSGFVTNTGAGALAGDPRDGSSQGELYFPYLGSIHEYFLRGVQCAFLPAGLGCQNISYEDESMCSLDNDVIKSQVLEDIIASAANWAHVPTEVLIAVVRGEGCGGGERTGGICQYTDAQVTQFSAPNASDPRNCLPRGRASGPLQIYYDSVNWDPWKNAVNMATSEGRTPNVCNIKDSVYAAAYILSAYYDGCANANHNVASIPTNWSETDMQRALTGWAQGCSAELCSGVAGGFYCDKLEQWSGQTTEGQCGGGGSSSSGSDAPTIAP